MSSQPNADVELYRAMHQVVAKHMIDSRRERRASTRRPYECIQLVAPYNGRRMPIQAEFQKVQCRDLSPNGFSFFCDRRPHERMVIAALGGVPFMLVEARVVRVTSTRYQGEPRWIVGCQFTHRVAGGPPEVQLDV